MARIATKILALKMLFLVVAAHAFTGCKALEPEYVKYDGKNKSTESSGEGSEKSPSSNGQNTQCDPVAAYKTHLKSAIDNVCSGCHATIAKLSLKKGADQSNHDTLLQYTGTTSTKLFEKVSNAGGSHPGGDQSSVLPNTKIDSWIEGKCD